MPNGVVDDPHVFVSIGDDGIVTIVCHRSEMGQGVRTGLPMIVADELEADWARVRVVQAPGDEKNYGNQDTDGSRSMRHFFQPMRRCGAAARQMLEAAAATRWGVPVAEVKAKHHEVVHTPSGRTLGYRRAGARRGRAAGAGHGHHQAQGPGRLPLHRQGQRAASSTARHHDRQGASTASTCVLPGMQYAVVARPPVFGGKVRGFDAARGAEGAGRA